MYSSLLEGHYNSWLDYYQLIMEVGSTVPELHVDIWSGNHPFFTGSQTIIDTEGRVEKFMRKYGMGGHAQAPSVE